MKKIFFIVLVSLELTISFVRITNATILQAWTATETTLFFGSLPTNFEWLENTLILNYISYDGSGKDTAYVSTYTHPDNFIPANAVGVSFMVSQSTNVGRVQLATQGYSADGYFIFQHDIYTPNNDMNFVANILSFQYGMDECYDIPESTENNITHVNFIFLEDLINSPKVNFIFYADSRGSAGTTTFSDVSWIISEGDMSPLPSPFHNPIEPIPEPSTILLITIGLGSMTAIVIRRKCKL